MSEPSSRWIISTSMETFRQDVIDQSMERPVVLDFWAEWCGPCRQLIPTLEKLAGEYAGRFVLVKVNVDESQQIAAAFGVQSIPMVVAMIEGQPVAQFQGVRSEQQIRTWLDEFIPSKAAEAFEEGQLHEAEGSVELAEASYRIAVQEDGEKPAYKIALARVLLGLDREQECREILDELNARGFLEPEAQVLQQQLDLRSQVEDSGGVQEARAAVEASPNDLSLQVRLAEALGADNRFEEACELCLSIISTDRSGVGQQAKEVMVGILGVMGPKSRMAGELRRRLATAFY